VSGIDDRLREELDALLDGALPEEQAAALRARIEAEPELRAEFERRRRTVELVRTLPQESAPGDFLAETLARVDAIGANAPPARVVPLWMWGGGLAAAAALVLAFVFGIDGPVDEPTHYEAREQREKFRDAEAEPAKKEGVAVLRADSDPADRARTVRDRDDAERALDRAAKSARKAPQPGRMEKKRASGVVAEEAEEAADADEPGGAAEEALDDAESRSKSFDAASGKKAGDPEDRDRTSLGVGGGAGGANELKKAKPAEASALMRKVEMRTTVLAPDDRRQYLEELAKTPMADLRAHLERVGQGSAPVRPPAAPAAKGGAKNGAKRGATREAKQADKRRVGTAPSAGSQALSFDLAVPKRTEAEALRGVLSRAFRPPPQTRTARDAGGKRAAPKPTATTLAEESSRGDTGELKLTWQVTPAQAGTISDWFRRIGLRSSQPGGALRERTARLTGESQPGMGKAKASKDGGKSAPAALETSQSGWEAEVVPIRVRIRFGAQPRTPERPRGEDR
jgi:hypothetical protein